MAYMTTLSRLRTLSLLAVVGLVGGLAPANGSGGSPGSIGSPATAPTSQPAARLSADDVAGLKSNVGKWVTVTGTISRAELSQSKKVFRIAFKEAGTSGFNSVVFDRNLRAFEAELGADLSAALTGKTVEVTGKLEEYREKPQVVLREPGQLKVMK